MKLEQVEKLINAGFTKEEIMKLEGEPKTEPEPVNEQEPEDTAADPEEQAAEPQKEQPDFNKFGDRLTVIENSLNALTRAIQANAVNQSSMGGLPNDASAEDALAEIIRPTFKERG